MKRFIFFSCLLAGCSAQVVPTTQIVPTTQVEKPFLTGDLGQVYYKPDGSVESIYMKLSNWPEELPQPKFFWMETKAKVILPEWYTWGKEAGEIRSDKLETAWKAHTPGLYKMEYKAPQQIFKEKDIDVGNKPLKRNLKLN